MPNYLSKLTSIVAAAGLSAFALSHAAAQDPAVVEAANSEGVVAWCNGNILESTAQKAVTAFNQRYPGIEIQSLRAPAEVVFQRLMQDLENNMHNCDVFGSSDGGHFAELVNQGALLEYVPAGAEAIDPQFESLYAPGAFYPATVFLTILIYNTERVAPEDAPTNWSDLVDPKWKSQASVGHPGYSGTMANWAAYMQRLYGDEFFEKLEENDPLIGRSSADPVRQLAAGERLIGVAPLGTAFVEIQRGAPIEIVYPEDGSLLVVTYSGVMKGAPHPNAAKLFMDFLLGPEFADINIGEGRHSFNPNAPSTPGLKTLSEVPVGGLTIEQINNDMPQAVEKWRQIFGG